MTHLRGDITKVNSILKKGYNQPIVQQTDMEVTQETIPGTTTSAWYVINEPEETAKSGFFKKISITVNDASAIMMANLTGVFGDTVQIVWYNYFTINGEFDLGDIPIEPNLYYVLTVQNNAAGAINMTANISYIEV